MIQPNRNLPPLTTAEPLGALERAAWVLAIVAVWMAMHLYAGLVRDAVLYTLQSLGHLQPQLWGQDLYLRFGAPDRYSLFTPLYGLLINATGLEHAAQLLTVAGQAAFFTCAWLLARALLTPRQALAGVLLLVALPGHYGAADIVRIAEDFVTPRLLAESLALAAIISWTQRSRYGALSFTLLAVAFDPLTGITALAFLLWLELAQPRPQLSLSLLLAGVALAMLVLVGSLAHGLPLRFDLAWYQWIPAHMSQLQIRHWSAADWGATLAPVGVLCAGIALLEPPARQLAQAALGIGLAGIALTAIGADQLHLLLITQGQPWRCLWLSSTLATLLAPLIAARLWRHSALGRASALLLLAQYLLMSERYAPLIAVLACGVLTLALMAAPHIPRQYQRVALLGALLVCMLALAVATANYFVVAQYHYFPDQPFAAPGWLKSLRVADRTGLTGFVLLGLLATLTAGTWRRATVPALLVLGALGSVALASPTWTLWTRLSYRAADKALFAGWRAIIPRGSEVLLADDPLFVWLILERPNYLSRAQQQSALYFRPAALILTQRELALRPYLRAQGLAFWEDEPTAEPGIPTLAMACAMPDLRFVVSRVPLPATPIAESPPGISANFRGLRLYQCPARADAS
jgi:hypothetical protein